MVKKARDTVRDARQDGDDNMKSAAEADFNIVRAKFDKNKKEIIDSDDM